MLTWIVLIVAVVILLAVVGSAMSGQDLEKLGARDADRQFEHPPNEGDLL
jgi:hypothetical protein